MTATPHHRERALERVAALTRTLDRIEATDEETLADGLPDALKDLATAPRLRTSLAVARAKKLAGKDVFRVSHSLRDMPVFPDGMPDIVYLSASAGARCLWREVIRLVARSDIDALDAELGIDSRASALRGRQAALDLAPVSERTADDIASKILTEGAVCWACWLSSEKPERARYLRMMTPALIAKRVGAALPDSAAERAMRRALIADELSAMDALTTPPSASSEEP